MPGTRPLRTRWSRLSTVATKRTRSRTCAAVASTSSRRAPSRADTAAARTTRPSAPAAVSVSSTRTGPSTNDAATKAAWKVPLMVPAIVSTSTPSSPNRSSTAFATSPGDGADAERGDADPGADHHVEDGEREHAFFVLETALQRAHPCGQREGGRPAEPDGPDERARERRRQAEHRDDDALCRYARAHGRQQVGLATPRKEAEATRRAHA